MRSSDLIQAIGCGTERSIAKNLRYSRIIVMTNADVDGPISPGS